MTLVEGRIVTGLDEFMLRLGHLSVLVDLADELGGARNRVARALAEWLTAPTVVPEAMIPGVGEYLARKKLALVVRGNAKTEPKQKSRYADVIVSINATGAITNVIAPDSEPLSIWREDLLISAEGVPSKVGAVTVETRHTSNKSGVSHLLDWALALGVLDKNLNAGAWGKVLHIISNEERRLERTNPYIVRGQRLAFLWILFQADGDVLRELLADLPHDRSVTKAEALHHFEDVFQRLYDSAFGKSSDATAAATRRVRDMRDDLGIAGGALADRARASTMWHRLSSRLESLVDLGLIEKTDNDGTPRPFEYVYRLTSNGRNASDSLKSARDTDEWLLANGTNVIAGALNAPQNNELVQQYLTKSLLALRGPTGLHIDSCSVLAASFALFDGIAIGVGTFRDIVLETAKQNPALARLARGHTGNRAEFVAVDFRELARLSDHAFETGQST